MAKPKILESGYLKITYYPYEKGRIMGWNEAIDEVMAIIDYYKGTIENPAYMYDENKLQAHIEGVIAIRERIKNLDKKET